jgi:hypothetical protein
LNEEYGLSVKIDRRLGVVESFFTFDGQPGHEIVLVYQARLSNLADYSFDRLPSRDADRICAVWREPRTSKIPLLPDEMVDFVGER